MKKNKNKKSTKTVLILIVKNIIVLHNSQLTGRIVNCVDSYS